MKQHLVMLGCSYTSPYDPKCEPEYYLHPKWPDLLADKLNCKSYENLAQSGCGSNFIHHELTKHLIESSNVDNIRCVIVAWPSANREDIKRWRRYGNSSAQWKTRILKLDMFEYIEHRWIEKTLVDMWSIHSLCGFYNIPYIGFQMGRFYDHQSDINVLTSVGLPTLEEMDMYKKLVANKCLSNNLNLCLYDELNLDKYKYNDNDSHFNEDGHKLVSEWVYDELQRLGY